LFSERTKKIPLQCSRGKKAGEERRNLATSVVLAEVFQLPFDALYRALAGIWTGKIRIRDCNGSPECYIKHTELVLIGTGVKP
jgi:hypothetical protein